MFAATTGLIDDRWQRFMQFQIARTRQIFAEAEAGVNLLAPDARRPVWCALRSFATPLARFKLSVLMAQAMLYCWTQSCLPAKRCCSHVDLHLRAGLCFGKILVLKPDRDSECRAWICGCNPNTFVPSCRSALILYRQILDGIEKNGYNNFTQRAYVPKWRKFLSLPRALMAARKPTTHSQASQQSPLKMS